MDSRVWRRAQGGEATARDDLAPVWPVLAELEVYTPSRRLFGWIAPEGERTSDWMNRGQEIELLAPMEVGVDAERPGLPPPQRDARRVRVASSEILFAVPPSLPPGRHLRLHRRVVRIQFEMGDYDVSGRIHVAPGADPGENLLRSTRTFVPITDAELLHHAEPPFARSLGVLVVNARNVSRVHHDDSAPIRRLPRSVVQAHVANIAAERASTMPDPLGTIEPIAGAVHGALSELAALHRDGLIDDIEFEAKRAEILARL
jgi:hypothetical protein